MHPSRLLPTYVVRTVSLAGAMLTASQSSAVGQKAGNGYQHYAAHVIQHSDSVVTLGDEYLTLLGDAFIVINDKDSAASSAALARIMATSPQYASRMHQKAEAFQRVSPPAGYERDHQQMGEALRVMVQHVDQVAKAFASCGCIDPSRVLQAGIMALRSILPPQTQAVVDYASARARVAGLLAKRRVKLPDLNGT